MDETDDTKLDVLKKALTDEELIQIPDGIANKLRSYFNENFEEYITAKAVFQHSRQSLEKKLDKLQKDCKEHELDLDECKGKLELADNHITELQTKLDEAKNEVYKLQESVKRLQKENSELRRQRDAAVDERDSFKLQTERRDHEVERLHTEITSLSTQLQAAVTAKCQAIADAEEIKSREMNLDYKEKRLDQERNLATQQISTLEVELAKRTSELQATRAEASSRALLVDTRLSQRDEELRISNETVTQLRETNSNLQRRCDELTQKIEEQRSHELSMHSSYREEINAQTRLADLYKGMADEANSKAEEFTNAVKELQTLLEQATEQYGLLETQHEQLKDHSEGLLRGKDKKIEELMKELHQANELLKSIKQERLDQAVEQLAPTAAITSRILKKGLSLTQIYTQLMDTVNELTIEREENEKLKTQMDLILRELEERAPILQQQREDYTSAVENVATLTNQLDELYAQNNQLQEGHDEAKRIAQHHVRENQRLKSELSDLARQVCFLLKEVQESRTGCAVLANNEISAMDTELASSDLISKKLVTFKDIEELQENNQKLLAVVRALSSRQEEIERRTDEINSGEIKEKIDRYSEQVEEMRAAQERQTKMVDNLMRQRDMYKNMYQQALSQNNKSPIKGDQSEAMEEDEKSTCENETAEESNKFDEQSMSKIKELERKLLDTDLKLKQITDEYEIYKREKAAHERMLGDEIDRLRKEAETNSTRCCRLKVQLDSSQERFNLLQTNVATYKLQIKSLEERCTNYSTTIGKHEQSIMLLKDETLAAQSRLSRAEVQLENLKQERQLLRDSEARLLKEREMLHRERQTNALLKADVESIKTSLERVQAEAHLRAEMRLDDSIRECAALRRRLQEEQDRFRELTGHLERQLTTAQERLSEEQSQTERLQAESEAARTTQSDADKRIDELEVKLREALTQSRAKPITGDENLAKRLQELELQLASANAEIRSLTEQLKTARQQNQQYGDIADSTEAQLKELTVQFDIQKRELDAALQDARNTIAQHENKIKSLEAELAKSQSGQQITDTELREKLSAAEIKLEELDEIKGELELIKTDLQTASQSAKEAEEKYAHEMLLHSADLQTLAKLRAEHENVSTVINELTRDKNAAIDALEAERTSFQERIKQQHTDLEEMQKRLEDLDGQNTSLHNCIQELSDRMAIMETSKSSIGGQDTSMNTSYESMNRSLSAADGDSESVEQFVKIITFLRREKDFVMNKIDVYKAENLRLKSQYEIAEKRLKESETLLNTQREQSEIDVVTTSKHAELMRKVETINAITDSNRILREERDWLASKVKQLEIEVSTLSAEVVPLREKARDLLGKNEALIQENTGLKGEATRWRQRANALVERANKASPEDWRRLQTERENLSKLLTSEREIHAKKIEELNALKAEKTKFEEQIVQLQRQLQIQADQMMKTLEEVRKLNQDLNEALTDSINKVKEIATLKKELSDKESILNDVRNKELQIRKIAKKYKTQYEELAKTIEEEKSKVEENANASNVDDTQAAAERENQLREEGRQELRQQIQELGAKVQDLTEKYIQATSQTDELRNQIENMRRTSNEKEERMKQLLKGARGKIMTLTESKNKCERELTDLKMKVDASSSDSEPSEHDARLAAIKSQLDGRISRLEHEKAELNTEKETLLQRVNQLQRQFQVGISGVNVTEPPTANIKPMSARAETPLASIRPMSVVVQSRTAAVLPTTANNPVLVTPQQQQQQQVVHTTETSSPTSSHTDYQPASTSSSVSQPVASNLRQLAVQPQLSDSAESTQREESENVENLTNQQPVQQQASQQQACQVPQPQLQAQTPQDQQTPQTVALVSPRVEQQQQQTQQPQQTTGSDQQQTIASSSTQSVSTSQTSTGHKRPRGHESSTSESGVVDGTEHSRSEQLPSPKNKRIRTQELASTATTSGSDIEYQVPTSSQRDQDEEGEEGCIVVVDCDEGEGGNHHQVQEEEEFDNDPYEEMEEDEEEDDEEEDEMPYGVEVEVGEGDNNEVEIIIEENSRNVEVPRAIQPAIPTNQPQQQQSEAISSAGSTGEQQGFASRSSRGIAPMPRQQQHFLLPQQGYEDGGDDSIVPSTPTLFVPRRGDGFGEAVSSPQVPQARFTFGDSAPSSTPTLSTPAVSANRTMYGASGSGVAQVVQEGMDDTRMDLTQLEESGTGRSVPTTPLQVSPAADLPPSTSSGQSEEPEAPGSATPTTVSTASDNVEATAVPSVLVTTDTENEQLEAIPGSSTATANDGVSSESDQQAIEIAASATAGNADDDSIDTAADEEDVEEEGREAEASPSINTRQRAIAAAAATSGATTGTTPTESRGVPGRRTRSQFRTRGARPTPIVWDNQSPIGQSPPTRGHPALRGANSEGTRGRGTRSRRGMRPNKYGYPRY